MTIRPARSRARALLVAAGAVAVASAAWVAVHRAFAPVRVVETAAGAALADAAMATASMPAQIARASAPAAATAVAVAASTPPMPPVESAAESLRKVQAALSGGTAQDDLVAAITLESCAHADKMANDLLQGRDAVNWLPDEVRKIFDKLPRVSDEMIARAQREQRRCQVFDLATLASRGELYRKAYEGGAEGAALPYLRWLKTEGAKDTPDPALVARLQAGVRADAQAADLPVLASFAFGGQYTADEAGADPVQAHAYREAYFRIVEQGSPGRSDPSRDFVSKLSLLGPAEPALTAQQQRDAEALTRQIVDAWHPHWHP